MPTRATKLSSKQLQFHVLWAPNCTKNLSDTSQLLERVVKKPPCFDVEGLIKIAVQCSKTLNLEVAKSLKKRQKYVFNDFEASILLSNKWVNESKRFLCITAKCYVI